MTRPSKSKSTRPKIGMTTTAAFERALAEGSTEKYVLRLYISGMTPKSMRAIENLEAICSEYLKDRCEIEVIDIYQHPQLIRGEQIVAAPTLIKKLPVPLRRLVGDLSNKERVIFGLDLQSKKGRSSRSSK